MKFGTIATMAAAVSLLGAPAMAQSMGGSSAPSPSAQGTTGMTTGDTQAPQGRSMSRDRAGGGMANGGMANGGSMRSGGGGAMGGGNMGGQPGTANPRNGY